MFSEKNGTFPHEGIKVAPSPDDGAKTLPAIPETVITWPQSFMSKLLYNARHQAVFHTSEIEADKLEKVHPFCQLICCPGIDWLYT